MVFPNESILGQSNLMVYYVFGKESTQLKKKSLNLKAILFKGVICPNDRRKLYRHGTAEFWL